MGAAVVAMEVAALGVAVLAFGWPVLLVGAPLLVGTLIVLAVVRLGEAVRQWRERRLTRRWGPATVPHGLMTGFFDVASVQDQPAMPGVDLPMLRAAREWSRESAGSLRTGRAAARILELSERLPRRR